MIRQYPVPHEPYDGSAEETPLVKLWYGILTDCLKRGSERIHLFLSDPSDLPQWDGRVDDEVLLAMKESPDDFRTFTIRAYANGAWEDVIKPTAKMYPAFLQRLKVMAGFSLATRLSIEQGRFRYAIGDSVFEIAVTVRVQPDGSQEAMVDLPSAPVQLVQHKP